MKTFWFILLFVGGMALAGVLVNVFVDDSKPAAVSPGTNAIAAAPVYHDQQTPKPAAGDTMITVEAERRPGVPMAPPRPLSHIESVPALPLSNQLQLLRRVGRDDLFAAARERMVTEQIAGPGRGIANPAVLQAMRTVLRHQFVPSVSLADAYVDRTLDMGYGCTLETPFVVAALAEQLAANPDARVLEVGIGPGYDAAVVSLLVKEIYATESMSIVAENARVELQSLGFTNNLFLRQAEVARGWPEAAPFDAIIFNRPLEQVSDSLLGQLKSGGRLIIPVAEDGRLYVLVKYGTQLVRQATLLVRLPSIPGNQVVLPPAPKMMLRPPP